MTVGTLDLVVEHTLEYVMRSLAAVDAGSAPRVLEIGCGSGELAVALGGRGVRVSGIDVDGESVRQARLHGVDAAEESWPVAGMVRTQRERYDAVLFTRSLHHVDRIEAALESAAAVLRRGGVLIIEDFGHDEVAADDAMWLRSLLEVIGAAGLCGTGEGASAGESALEWWKREHHHDLHPWSHMEAEVKRVIPLCASEATEYLFRYVDEALRGGKCDRERRERVTRTVLASEQRRARELGHRLVGRRLIARRES